MSGTCGYAFDDTSEHAGGRSRPGGPLVLDDPDSTVNSSPLTSTWGVRP